MFSHGLHSSCSMFSHGIHGIHRTFLLYVLPQIAQIFTEPSCCMFSHRFHSKFAEECDAVAFFCKLRVKSVGEYFQQPLP